jgi:FkbM family methyltransferase
LRKLYKTPAEQLQSGHIDSLELLELLRDKPPRVIYDIGANIGTWTLLAKAIFSDAEVHAFEPLGKLKNRFLSTTQSLSNVYLHTVALGSRFALMPMKVADFVDASSLLEMTEAQTCYFNVRPAGEEIVTVENLDEYVERLSLPKPNLIKLDIQGYELEALRGAEKCLETADAVLSEVSFIEFYREQCMFHDLVGFLASRGFRLQSFSGKTRVGTRLLQSDVLFERAHLVASAAA